MKNRSLHRIQQIIGQIVIFFISLLVTYALKAENLGLISDIEHHYGLYAIDIIKMILGIITIISAFGFFITTSQRRAHWPSYFRRIFFGIFIFSSIFSQAFFNVINIPAQKKIVCALGRCIQTFTKKSNSYKENHGRN